jgi:hypothetical protein
MMDATLVIRLKIPMHKVRDLIDSTDMLALYLSWMSLSMAAQVTYL